MTLRPDNQYDNWIMIIMEMPRHFQINKIDYPDKNENRNREMKWIKDN